VSLFDIRYKTTLAANEKQAGKPIFIMFN